MARPIRVLISKIGLDGHDRGAKLIVRNLRDAGMEVIYTGLWQTPQATVLAAMQEDVDVIGVSLLSAAHMTIMPELVRLCREHGIPETPVVVGGIIPEQDKQPLRDMGVGGVFNPGTSLTSIIDEIKRLSEARRGKQSSRIPDIRTVPGLARAVTWIVEGRGQELGAITQADASREGAACGASSKKSICIGVTGAPGVGKSTFIGKLARALRARDKRVAVVAVDPSSPITGGSVLGDRLRMMSSEPDPGLYVRSLSSGGQAGGLAPHCEEITRLLASAGYEIVLLETVGAGQSDTEVRRVADEVLLVLMPGAGDTVQFVKAGIIEIATGFVVNKADLAGADKTMRQLREALEDDRPIWRVSSLRGEGLEPLCDWVLARQMR